MNLNKLRETALSLNCAFKENEVLSQYTRLQIGGRSLFYIKPSSWDSAKEIVKLVYEEKIPFKILGKGTNVLISDKNLDFGVIHISGFENKISFSETSVSVSADTALSFIAEKSFDNSLSGLEELCLIPGTVGGCAVMNAGAFGKTIFDLIENLTLLDFKGEEKKFSKDDFEVGYRKTNIKKFGIVKQINMKLQSEDNSIIKKKIGEYKEKRDLSQPWKERTCGSVFKNPAEMAAGKILEELGFKGKQRGKARFSEKHANFLIAETGASFDDAFALIEEAKEEAMKKGFILELEMEVWQDAAN